MLVQEIGIFQTDFPGLTCQDQQEADMAPNFDLDCGTAFAHPSPASGPAAV
jgi:hypothetical protein